MLRHIFNAIEQLFNKTDDTLAENCHPEVDDYGLSCDFKLWSEFNKELLIRNWIKSSRQFLEKTKIPDSNSYEYQCGNARERQMAEQALEELIEFGYLNPISYLRKEKSNG